MSAKTSHIEASHELTNSNPYLSIGLMSGTSMDGIDAALIETDGLKAVKELGYCSLSYDPIFKIALKAAEFSVRKSQGNIKAAENSFEQNLPDYLTKELHDAHPEKTIDELRIYLHNELSLAQIIATSTELHAKAVKQLLQGMHITANQIAVIGYHGQALFHQPHHGISIIVGDGQALANELKIPVINDFRSNDIAHGGQGAPFAPLYHLALCARDYLIPAAIVNCGGIANITLINTEKPEDLIAFDVGPGNGLIDRLVRQRTKGLEHMDENGRYGQQGKVNEVILNELFAKAIMKDQQNYFDLKPPKSLDIGDLHLIPELDSLSLADACRNLEAFTAKALVHSIQSLNIQPPKTWILAGGGWNNPVILNELQEALSTAFGKEFQIKTAQDVGWNSQALEAQIFAYLAVRSLKKLPLSMPGTTGVSQPISGGKRNTPIMNLFI